MNVDLNSPLFVSLKFVRAVDNNCKQCVFLNSLNKVCLSQGIPCDGGHWELKKVLPPTSIAYSMLLVEDSVKSVGVKAKQIESEMQQIKEESEQEPKYFY